MDNVTHAIAGIVTAEVVILARRALAPAQRESAAFARAAWLVSAVAHNLPDADAVTTGITGGTLGYLLHHRGHTHTFVAAPVVAALSYGIGLAWARLRRWKLGAADRRWLALLALVGPIGHVLLDLSNDYGVHPLWPLDARWYYGDAVFIVEPLFWAVTIPVVVAATTARWGRVVWSAILAVGLALTFFVGLVPWQARVLVALATLASIGVSWRAPPSVRALYALAASLVVLVAFAVGSAASRAVIHDAVARAHPGWETLDVARSPLPGAPWCWDAVVVQRAGERYALRLVRASAWPAIASAAACRTAEGRALTAPLAPGVGVSPAVLEVGSFEDDVADLRRRAARCDVGAYLRWSRAPFVVPDGGGLVVGDLRYDRSEDVEFAEMRVGESPSACPKAVPPWTPPRSDLLE